MIDIKVTYDLIQECFPDLLVMVKGKLYFSDLGISNSILVPSIKKEKSLELHGSNFRLDLYFDHCSGGILERYGSLYMHYDFKLSDQSCVYLHQYNINVMFRDFNSPYAGKWGSVSYDMASIARRHTIKNIING